MRRGTGAVKKTHIHEQAHAHTYSATPRKEGASPRNGGIATPQPSPQFRWACIHTHTYTYAYIHAYTREPPQCHHGGLTHTDYTHTHTHTQGLFLEKTRNNKQHDHIINITSHHQPFNAPLHTHSHRSAMTGESPRLPKPVFQIRRQLLKEQVPRTHLNPSLNPSLNQ